MDELVYCPGCKSKMAVGTIVDLAGEDLLMVNGIIVRAFHGVCSRCGKEFHWSMSDRTLSRITRRLREIEARVLCNDSSLK